MVSHRTRERPRWQRLTGGLVVAATLAYGIAATFGRWPPAEQIDRMQEQLLGEADLYYTLILTWFVLLIPGALALTTVAIAVGGRDAAWRETAIARATAIEGARYYSQRFSRLWSWFRSAGTIFRRRQ